MREIGVLVNSYYSLIADAVLRSRGDIDRFCGPVIVSLFNQFERIEDAQRAQAIVSLSKVSDSLKSEFGVRLGTGICRGTMLCGVFGSAARKSFSALGAPLLCAEHLAASDDPMNVCESMAGALTSTSAGQPLPSPKPHRR